MQLFCALIASNYKKPSVCQASGCVLSCIVSFTYCNPMKYLPYYYLIVEDTKTQR